MSVYLDKTIADLLTMNINESISHVVNEEYEPITQRIICVQQHVHANEYDDDESYYAYNRDINYYAWYENDSIKTVDMETQAYTVSNIYVVEDKYDEDQFNDYLVEIVFTVDHEFPEEIQGFPGEMLGASLREIRITNTPHLVANAWCEIAKESAAYEAKLAKMSSLEYPLLHDFLPVSI